MGVVWPLSCLRQAKANTFISSLFSWWSFGPYKGDWPGVHLTGPLTGMTPERSWVPSWFQHSDSPNSGQLRSGSVCSSSQLPATPQDLWHASLPLRSPFWLSCFIIFLKWRFFFPGSELSFLLWNVFSGSTSLPPLLSNHSNPTPTLLPLKWPKLCSFRMCCPVSHQ